MPLSFSRIACATPREAVETRCGHSRIALPEGLPIGVEAPCAQDAALPIAERARRCGEATHRFLEQYRRSPASGSPDV